ncbi:hypothetical protein [Streptomyces sp. NPDC087300]|uniref:hypothetical protein n=1 Tax=Streptomyces sp. NPDC087300 TaxID=3365780 RepID=UPI00381AC4D0
MYISPGSLSGSRRHRLVAGTMLCLFMCLAGAILTATAFGDGLSGLARLGLGAGAVSVLAVAWWCARYWYAAFREGRGGPPVPGPNPWPWLLPWAVLFVAVLVSGVRALDRGESDGWFFLGFAGLIGLPALAGLVAGLVGLVRGRGRGHGADGRGAGGQGAAVAPDEPEGPRRAWGPVG